MLNWPSIGGINYQPRQQNAFPMGMPYGRRQMRMPGGGWMARNAGMVQQPGQAGPSTATFGRRQPQGQGAGALDQSQYPPGGYQYPFQFPEMMGLGDFYTPHGPGDAQNVPNAAPGANFIGNQWGQGAIL